MRRRNVALLIHPFKNQLCSRERLKEGAVACGRALADLLAKNTAVRLNVVMPGYALECLDGLLVSELREHTKRGAVEWLVSGLTEPFVSLSPVWLTAANVRAGAALVTELFGAKPSGFVPPFSNYEPLAVEPLRGLGLNYVVISAALLPPRCRDRCGFWATEHLGAWIVLFPSHMFHSYTVPASLSGWLENAFAAEGDGDLAERPSVAGLHYLTPFVSPAGDPFGWLRSAVRSLTRAQERYQTVLYGTFLGENQPLGLQYLQPSLDVSREYADPSSFRNWLFSFHQAGLLHRRLLEVCDEVEANAGQRGHERMVRELLTAHDINRFLPDPDSGCQQLADRFWTYGKLVEIEKQLPEARRLRGGQIRIVDHLRTGSKSIIMANRSLRAYISHRSGGALYELDFYGRCVNLIAACEPQPAVMPHVLLPGQSRLSFVDHLLPAGTRSGDMAGVIGEQGDFVRGWFDYKVHKTPDGVKAVLGRQGILAQGERNCPLAMEKVFGLERDRPELSFAYRLENSSAAAYHFRFATEISLALPGAAVGRGRLVCGKTSYDDYAWERLSLEGVTELVIEDWLQGLRVTLMLHKPLAVWCQPVGSPGHGYQGTTLVLSAPVELAGGAFWGLMGKVSVRAIRRR